MRYLAVFLLLLGVPACAQKQVASPDNNVVVTVTGGATLQIAANYKERVILQPSQIGMTIRGVSHNWTFGKSSIIKKDEVIIPPV
ncbi:MAG TPA: glycoside hydrolase family 97 N-terminal domain-containing protein, partial [Cyclobacteriaceae bacterium]|nr:glycoside hydrolase family 97 N-terminal domain-containing protein [Cyclobacteriaceae bacterium]